MLSHFVYLWEGKYKLEQTLPKSAVRSDRLRLQRDPTPEMASFIGNLPYN
jgi:hypothetical protein